MRPVPALPWDPFVICLLDIPTVIGGGSILEANAEKYRPVKASVTLPYLPAMQQKNLHDTLMWFFRKRLDHPVGMDYIIRTTGLTRKDVHSEIQRMLHSKELVSLNLRGYYGKRAYETLKAGLLQAIRKALKEDSLKETVNAEEVKAKVAPSIEQGFLLHILDELCLEGSLVRAGGGYQAPGITGNLSKEQEALIALLLDYASKSGLNPFSADTIWKLHAKRIDKKLIQKHLNYLKSQRKLVLLGDKRFLSTQALEEIKTRVGHVIEKKGAFAIGDFTETLGYGRSVAIPVVEYLDTIGFTRRMGDVRVLMKP
jgi:selenocysteine-specific elongation factor